MTMTLYVFLLNILLYKYTIMFWKDLRTALASNSSAAASTCTNVLGLWVNRCDVLCSGRQISGGSESHEACSELVWWILSRFGHEPITSNHSRWFGQLKGYPVEIWKLANESWKIQMFLHTYAAFKGLAHCFGAGILIQRMLKHVASLLLSVRFECHM